MINSFFKYVFNVFVFLLLISNAAKGCSSKNIYSFETGLVERCGIYTIDQDYPVNAWRRHAHKVIIHSNTQESLHMVPIVPGHYRHMLRLSQDPEVMKLYEIQKPYDFPRERFKNWVQRGDECKPTWWFIFKGEAVCEEGFVGAAGAYLDPMTQIVNVCGLGLPEFWGKGYASTIFPHVLERVDSFLDDGYEGFDATVHPMSAATLKLLTNAGFCQYGKEVHNNAGHPRLEFILSRDDYKSSLLQ